MSTILLAFDVSGRSVGRLTDRLTHPHRSAERQIAVLEEEVASAKAELALVHSQLQV